LEHKTAAASATQLVLRTREGSVKVQCGGVAGNALT
jgi:hypothetical protein